MPHQSSTPAADHGVLDGISIPALSCRTQSSGDVRWITAPGMPRSGHRHGDGASAARTAPGLGGRRRSHAALCFIPKSKTVALGVISSKRPEVGAETAFSH
jgi:hypothetical protein